VQEVSEEKHVGDEDLVGGEENFEVGDKKEIVGSVKWLKKKELERDLVKRKKENQPKTNKKPKTKNQKKRKI
jgi:hypothetical protein